MALLLSYDDVTVNGPARGLPPPYVSAKAWKWRGAESLSFTFQISEKSSLNFTSERSKWSSLSVFIAEMLELKF